jgi:hypothetical protein
MSSLKNVLECAILDLRATPVFINGVAVSEIPIELFVRATTYIVSGPGDDDGQDGMDMPDISVLLAKAGCSVLNDCANLLDYEGRTNRADMYRRTYKRIYPIVQRLCRL